MAVEDSGVVSKMSEFGDIAFAMVTFLGISLYNVLELNCIIFATFKARRGLYFWSFLVATWGVAIYSVGFLTKYILSSKLGFLYTTATASGWVCMVTGQSVVLYSRLHLVLHNRTRLRMVLGMIIFNAIIGHVPTIVLVYCANSTNPEPFLVPYSIYEKLQVTLFFIQEFTISSLYIYETVKFMKLQRAIRGKGSVRRIMMHLVCVNITVVILDITILGLEYSGLYQIQNTYKGFAYSVKLKLEFSILNRLVELTQDSKGGSSYDCSRTDRDGDIYLGTMQSRVSRNETRHKVGHNAYVERAIKLGDEVSNANGVFTMTEIHVCTERASEVDLKSTSVQAAHSVESRTPAGGRGASSSSSASSEIQFARLGA